MADTKSSALTELTGANLATGDLAMVVDVSDATMAASGTNKKIGAGELLVGLATISSGVTLPTGLTLAAGTLTTAISPLKITATYNDAAVIFPGIEFALTDTASDASSLFAAFKVGGNRKVTLGKTATLNLYNTDDGTNYERGFIRWASNVLEIGTEMGGTGTLREVRLTAAAGNIYCNAQAATDKYANVVVGRLYGFADLGTQKFSLSGQESVMQMVDTFLYKWSSTSSYNGTADLGFSRNAAGVMEVNNGTAGTFRDLKLRNLIGTAVNATAAAAPTIASAATIAPTVTISFVSGTTAIDTITAPSPISAGGGQIVLVPTGLWSTTTAGNIALATTAVVNKALMLTYDTTTAKWYPSY